MQNFGLLLLFVLICFSCSGQEIIFNTQKMGGPDIHGELYRKKYEKPDDSEVTYNTWPGVEVNSNEQLIALLRSNPECEAIRFSLWSHQEFESFALTEKIGAFKNLKFLEIHSNKITKYPKSIGQLKNLEELVLQVGGKKEIEFSFSGLKNLRHLTIHFAEDLERFPSSIFDCHELETLKLFRFYIQDENVLEGIHKLENLRELYIWDSYLLLPDAPYNFKQLETLILDRYREAVPDYFYSLKTLKKVVLSTMYDTLDMQKVSGMENVEALFFYFQNHFTGKLTLDKLEHLKIVSFNGENIDIGINILPKLESLTIWDCNKLSSITKISNPNLRSIEIGSNDKLTSIDLDVDRLKSLEYLKVRYNKILTSVPTVNDGVTVDTDVD
jgi:Leucine-rich repeat (LRR) protein